MKYSALLAFIAWRLSLVQPIRVIQSFNTNGASDPLPDAISDIRLLVPLSEQEYYQHQWSEPAYADDEQDDRAQNEQDDRAQDEPDDRAQDEQDDRAWDEQENRAQDEQDNRAQGECVEEGSEQERAGAESEQELSERLRAKLEWEDEQKDVWRACTRLANEHALQLRQMLLSLCAEMLNEAGFEFRNTSEIYD